MPTSLPALAAGTVTGGLLVAMVLAGVVTKAGDTDEKPARDLPSTIGLAMQMIAFAGTGLGSLDFVPAMQRGDWIRTIVVLVLGSGAVWLFHASRKAMGRNWSIIARTRDDHALVTDGPFALVRNPIYAALALLLLAQALAMGHGASLIVTLPLYTVGTLLRVRSEEAKLRAHFGAAWNDYAARVPRFFPGPRGI